ncbi:uncharacterized protein LOC125251409 [Megalobrama amblycephala]|uniref:uncharacterized protein LOC125251409 n=1 Tax=Megalobrama amblycephala TaxID=75352 RepID=UPI002013C7CA|nr:uncharacterized protein LOC125251409 [Megalobrama amblycephala]
MADHVVFVFFIADEVEAIEIPLLLHEIEHNDHQRIVPKILHFVEDVMPLYSPSEFKGHFRLSRDQVEDVITTIGPYYMNLQQTKLPLTNSVLACLWTLANQESYRGVADRFNLAKSTLSKQNSRRCSLLITQMNYHISWPRGQWLQISKLAFDAAGFPNTVCAVDGCHIPIMRPHCRNPLAYLNRKQFYSVVLTGFCDSQRRFFSHQCGSHWELA